MTAIVSFDFDWSIESCDKAPHDLDYERNTEKYGRAMKLTIPYHYSELCCNKEELINVTSFLSCLV